MYPNRDSISYIDIYGIPEAETIYRGPFRYKGWCETLDAMKHLKLLDDMVEDYSGMYYAGFLAHRAGTEKTGLRENISAKLGIEHNSIAVKMILEEIINLTGVYRPVVPGIYNPMID